MLGFSEHPSRPNWVRSGRKDRFLVRAFLKLSPSGVDTTLITIAASRWHSDALLNVRSVGDHLCARRSNPYQLQLRPDGFCCRQPLLFVGQFPTSRRARASRLSELARSTGRDGQVGARCRWTSFGQAPSLVRCCALRWRGWRRFVFSGHVLFLEIIKWLRLWADLVSLNVRGVQRDEGQLLSLWIPPQNRKALRSILVSDGI